jgi:hypothetical protein
MWICEASAFAPPVNSLIIAFTLVMCVANYQIMETRGEVVSNFHQARFSNRLQQAAAYTCPIPGPLALPSQDFSLSHAKKVRLPTVVSRHYSHGIFWHNE